MAKDNLAERVTALEAEVDALRLGMSLALDAALEMPEARARAIRMLKGVEDETGGDTPPALARIRRQIREAIQEMERPRRLPGVH